MSLLVQNLHARVGEFEAFLDHLEITPGTIACLMGRSGSGKSTLLNAIAGFIPSEGEIFLGQVPLHTLPEKRRMALVFQRSALFPHLTVLGNIEFGLRLQGVAAEERTRSAIAWLARLGLPEIAARRISAISEGQAQRVALARALAPGFPVLLLDEPFSALDVQTRNELRPLLKKLVQEQGVSALLGE